MSKKIYAGGKIVELCTASAVLNFNEGILATKHVLERLGISPGHHCERGMMIKDNKRVYMAK